MTSDSQLRMRRRRRPRRDSGPAAVRQPAGQVPPPYAALLPIVGCGDGSLGTLESGMPIVGAGVNFGKAMLSSELALPTYDSPPYNWPAYKGIGLPAGLEVYDAEACAMFLFFRRARDAACARARATIERYFQLTSRAWTAEDTDKMADHYRDALARFESSGAPDPEKRCPVWACCTTDCKSMHEDQDKLYQNGSARIASPIMQLAIHEATCLFQAEIEELGGYTDCVRVPAHVGDVGNSIADAIAKWACYRPPTTQLNLELRTFLMLPGAKAG